MTGTKGIVVLTGVVVIAMLVGCTQLFWDEPEQSGYIELNIGHPAAVKGISITEHGVTGLYIEIYDPDDYLLDTVAWDVQDGSKSYLIQVSEAGLYRIEVTHISDDDGEPMEATEHATFNIQAMVITEINITPGVIGMIGVSGEEHENGTLTVSVTDVAAPEETSVLMGVFPAGIDPGTDPMALILAMGHIVLFGGSGNDTVSVPDSEDLWIGTGGEFYDVYIWVDVNDNLDIVMYPEPGIDLQLSTFPVTVEIDGDTHLSFQGSDFVVVP
jgi:hypothetical protein